MNVREFRRKVETTKKFLSERSPSFIRDIAVGWYKTHYRNTEWYNKDHFEQWQITERQKIGGCVSNDYRPLHSKRNNLFGSIKGDIMANGVMISSRTKYSRIQNEGGTTDIPVTKKMKKYMWYMYFKTAGIRKAKPGTKRRRRKRQLSDRAKFYLNFATTKKTVITVTIPKRPFLYPNTHVKNVVGQALLTKLRELMK